MPSPRRMGTSPRRMGRARQAMAAQRNARLTMGYSTGPPATLATPAAANGAAAVAVTAPTPTDEQDGITAEQQTVYLLQGSRTVMDHRQQAGAINTKTQYHRVKKEYQGFCKALQRPGIDPFPFSTVTEPSVFMFLYYTAHREKRDNQSHHHFDEADFRRVMAAHPVGSGLFDNEKWKYLAPSAVMAAYAALIDLAKDNQQKLQIYVSENPELYTPYVPVHERHVRQVQESTRIKEIKKLVQKRVAKLKLQRCDEKSSEMMPFEMIEWFPKIELRMWVRNQTHRVDHISAARNRFVYNFTLQGLMRGESVQQAELSDLFCFRYKHPKEPSEYLCGAIGIIEGKINLAAQGITNYGRALRHKDPCMCAWGALMMYLFARFNYTGELADLDLTENDNWFRIKLLVDCSKRADRTKAINLKDTYTAAIKEVLEGLDITAKHKAHFGRFEGTALLEVEEVEHEEISAIGNWNLDVRKTVYSQHMPLKGMRVMAGFGSDRGSYYNPRVTVEPPEELKAMIFPELEALEQQIAVAGHERKSTARNFLNVLRTGRTVILQDAAWMMHLGRTHHRIMQEAVFKHPLFAQFQQQVVTTVMDAEANHPERATLQTVAPLIDRRLSHSENILSTHVRTQQQVQMQVERLSQRVETVHSMQLDILRNQATIMERMDRGLSVGVMGGGGTGSRQQAVARRAVTPAPSFVSQPQLTSRPRVAQAAHGSQTNQYHVIPGVAPCGGDDVALLGGVHLSNTYSSLQQVFIDWHGLHTNLDPNAAATGSVSAHGGIAYLEEKYQASWRSGYTAGEKKKLSRIKSIMSFVDQCINANIQLAGPMADVDGITAQVVSALSLSFTSLSSMEEAIKKKKIECPQLRAAAVAPAPQTTANAFVPFTTPVMAARPSPPPTFAARDMEDGMYEDDEEGEYDMDFHTNTAIV